MVQPKTNETSKSEAVIAAGRYALPKDKSTGSKSKGVTDKILTAAACIATILCLGLSFGALVHAQFDCLAWVPVSLLPWFLIVVFHRLSRSAYAPDKSSCATVSEHQRRTESGEFEIPTLENGALAWFTTQGVFIESGRFFPWKRFSAIVVESAGPDENGHIIYAIILSVLRSRTIEVFLWEAVVIPASVVAVGIALLLQVKVIFAGASALGWRVDVLALLFATLLEVVFLISLTSSAIRNYKRPAATSKWTIYIDGSVSDDAIRFLIDRH